MAGIFVDHSQVAFFFKVEIDGISNPFNSDASFQEVSGVHSEVKTMEASEGGENRFKHRLPEGTSHGNLELKRGVLLVDSPLYRWCVESIGSGFAGSVECHDVKVSLMLPNAATPTPHRTWLCRRAYPVKWEVDGLCSTKNEIAIQKITLIYSSVEMIS